MNRTSIEERSAVKRVAYIDELDGEHPNGVLPVEQSADGYNLAGSIDERVTGSAAVLQLLCKHVD